MYSISSLLGGCIGLFFASVYFSKAEQYIKVGHFLSPQFSKINSSSPFLKLCIQYFIFSFLGCVLGNAFYVSLITFVPCMLISCFSAGLEMCFKFYDNKITEKETQDKES